MTLDDALAWVRLNCTDEEALHRLRSRRVAKTLADEIESLRKQLAECQKERDSVIEEVAEMFNGEISESIRALKGKK